MLAWDPYECERGDVLWSECYMGGLCDKQRVITRILFCRDGTLWPPLAFDKPKRGGYGVPPLQELQHSFADLLFLSFTKFVQLFAQLRTAIGEDSNREKGRVGRARLANRERCDGNPARHLDRGQ
jgi:hypothetical protein